MNVRDFIKSEELEVRDGLGPNGALIKSLELISESLNEILKPLTKGFDYALIDTPGQMEAFLTRDVSAKLSRTLSTLCRSQVALFIIDSTLISRPEDYAFMLTLSVAAQLRMGVPAAPVLSKADLISDELLKAFSGDLIGDYGGLVKGLGKGSAYSEMLREVIDVVYKYAKAAAVPKVSAVTGEGLEELHRLVMEFMCSCGDLT